MINVSTTANRRDRISCTRVPNIPQNNQCCTSPYLLHTKFWIAKSYLTAQYVLIEMECFIHVVDKKNNMIDSQEIKRHIILTHISMQTMV